jgi:hypothetical protein
LNRSSSPEAALGEEVKSTKVSHARAALHLQVTGYHPKSEEGRQIQKIISVGTHENIEKSMRFLIPARNETYEKGKSLPQLLWGCFLTVLSPESIV